MIGYDRIENKRIEKRRGEEKIGPKMGYVRTSDRTREERKR